MQKARSPKGGYITAAFLGAAAGGITVTIITRAIPGIMPPMMSTMMGEMMSQMDGEDCNPEEM